MATQRARRDPGQQERPGLGRFGTRALEVGENVVYAGIALFLVVSALVLLVVAGKTTWGMIGDLSQAPVLELLDVLLLVFIIVELLFAVRITVERRELVAEPFLLVGIIASIKEIVVLSVEAAVSWARARSSTTGSPRSASSACWSSCSGARPGCCG
ncbi:phosphate-starvation-inducible PsiE family protein [Modestobacter caceresii]|uniref:phosphate-starvation-inducible PsiE family protein n=1 Tax=Modestobacter caceresii TaxID=1522368 RepID=UPI000B13A1EC|nr:phosphate-starvation-inducible PsiE family protein [Modestobacter caceresii]